MVEPMVFERYLAVVVAECLWVSMKMNVPAVNAEMAHFEAATKGNLTLISVPATTAVKRLTVLVPAAAEKRAQVTIADCSRTLGVVLADSPCPRAQ